MSDAILLIHADSAGNPSTPGTVGHFVRISSNPRMVAVNEFNDGGHYPHADCGPACILSTLADRGQHPSAAAVEAACGTVSNGTQVDGVSAGLGHFGVVNSWARGIPESGYIMNPAGGRLLPPSAFPAYLAASQGWLITVHSPDPWNLPGPSPTLSVGDDVTVVAIRSGNTVDPAGAGAVYLVKDAVYGPKRHILGVVAGAIPAYLAACGQKTEAVIDAFILDRMELGPDIDLTASPPEA